ncbi:MAG: hypothetical protein ACR2IE_16340 [Candidatus Sumerlaeaceae bacterium]
MSATAPRSTPLTFQQVVDVLEHVQERLYRVKQALEDAGIPYAVVGGNAVASWVASVNRAAIRTTGDVDILLDPADLERAKVAMAKVDFHFRHAAGVSFFQDGRGAKFEDSVHLVLAGTKIRKEYACPAPAITEVDRAAFDYAVLSLEALVRMKLTSYRNKDRVHLEDMLKVGLLDESWMDKVPEPLRPRMREVLDNPPDDH